MTHRRLFVVSLIASLSLMVILQAVDGPLRTAAAPQGIVSFELAGTAEQAAAIVQSWDILARMHAGLSLGLDYLFMLAYATAFMLACLWAATRWSAAWARWLGQALAWAMPVAAVADAIENAALWRTLHEPVAPWPALARSMALIKFGLLAAALLFVVLTLLGRGVSGLRRQAEGGG